MKSNKHCFYVTPWTLDDCKLKPFYMSRSLNKNQDYYYYCRRHVGEAQKQNEHFHFCDGVFERIIRRRGNALK